MVTLREGELDSVSNIVPASLEEALLAQEAESVLESKKDPSAQPWQNRWRRQSTEQEVDNEPPLEASSEVLRSTGTVKFRTAESLDSYRPDDEMSMSRRDSIDSAEVGIAPIVSEKSRMSHASLASDVGGLQSRRGSKELASEGKLVGIPNDGEADIPMLPAPVETRRRTVIAHQIQEFLAPPPTDTVTEEPKPRDTDLGEAQEAALVGEPTRRSSEEKSAPEPPAPEKREEEKEPAAQAEPMDLSPAAEEQPLTPELPKPLLSEDRAASQRPSESPRGRVRVKSRTSLPEGAQRPIRADGLQELLQEVYDKFRTCSAHLRHAGQRQALSPSGEPVPGSEDTDLADTWQEVEWLRQAVVGMHSHLLLAQKRQNALEKKCKDFQDRISEVRQQGVTGDVDDTSATISAPKEAVPRRKQEVTLQQEPTATTSTVVSYDAQRPQQCLQVPRPGAPPVSYVQMPATLQGTPGYVLESPRTAASTPTLPSRTHVVVQQSTLQRPREVPSPCATPPRQLRTSPAVYAAPVPALHGQATPPPPGPPQGLTAPVYAARRPEVRSEIAALATPPRGRSDARWPRSGQATMVPALAATPTDFLSRSLTPTRSAPMALPAEMEPLTSPRGVAASPAQSVRAWLSPPPTSSAGLLYGSGSISAFGQLGLTEMPSWVPGFPPPPPIVSVPPRFAMPANPFLSQTLP